MKILIDKNEHGRRDDEVTKKKRRKNEKERAQRRNEEGLTPKQTEKKKRLQEVKLLYENGLNQVQIAEIIGVNRITILRYIKYLKEKSKFFKASNIKALEGVTKFTLLYYEGL